MQPTRFQLGLIVAVAIALTANLAQAQKEYDPRKWEDTIAKFEAKDKESAPPQGAVLFIGSSSIRMWDLDKSFEGVKMINRGFGGSHIEDSTYYADRIIWPYKPRTIVLYAGDNDVKFGKSPDTVVAHFEAFVSKVREKLPETKIIFLPIKPSIARWNLWPKMNEANQRIKAITEKDDRLAYADCATPMLPDDGGKPATDLFIKDGLHLSDKGYRLWSGVVAPMIAAKVKK